MPWFPLCLGLSLIVVGLLIRRALITLPASVAWPESNDLAIALQWTESLKDASRILGSPSLDWAMQNRKSVIRQQRLDALFIVLCVSFFIAVASFQEQQHVVLFGILLVVAVAAGVCNFIEDFRIVRLCRNQLSSPRLISQAKWILFFFSLPIAAYCFVWSGTTSLDKQLLTAAIAVAATTIAAFGIIATLRLQFQDFSAAVRLAVGIMAILAVLPLVLEYRISIGHLVEYAMLMRVPILTAAILVSLPLIARYTRAKSLLLGMFDVTPARGAFVALAACLVAGVVSDDSRVIYLRAADRIPGLLPAGMPGPTAPWWIWVALTAVLSLPMVVFSVRYSNQQNERDLVHRIAWAAGSLLVTLSAQVIAVLVVKSWDIPPSLNSSPLEMLNGFFPVVEHLTAALGFLIALGFYISLGIHGRRTLGKSATVPALCSALMVLMLACSTLSALTFFLDKWHIPLILVLFAIGFLTAQSSQSDHLYKLWALEPDHVPAPSPIETVRATKASCHRRMVLVAANGGGIQAAAWTAQVLEGLSELDPRFPDFVRLISSVSGGSLGSACYTYRLAEGSCAANAAVAASRSSLDEVAWGIGWPDLMRSVFPWWSEKLIGRGKALERAWIANCSREENGGSNLGKPLSRWNAKVATGDLPAVIFNATIVETGERLLFGTTCFSDSLVGRARVNAISLHNGKDVAAVTAARLSASFPYVTPAARADSDGPQVHVVDGGYYDNYGMSTLVEWLDEALTSDHASDDCALDEVLVLQIHGAPVGSNKPPQPKIQNRGWFFQILAPATTLNAVRGAGQLAHNDIELQLMQDKWKRLGVPIHTLTFEFPDDDAPLSWHLTQKQSEQIFDCWKRDKSVLARSAQVMEFLRGSKSFHCDCPWCQTGSTARHVYEASDEEHSQQVHQPVN